MNADKASRFQSVSALFSNHFIRKGRAKDQK